MSLSETIKALSEKIGSHKTLVYYTDFIYAYAIDETNQHLDSRMFDNKMYNDFIKQAKQDYLTK